MEPWRPIFELHLYKKKSYFFPWRFFVRSVGAGKLFVWDFRIHPGFTKFSYKTGDFQMPITLSKISYDTRSIEHFEALEQTLRLRLVSGLVDNFFFS
jgi:hypothetical protein